MTLNRRLKVGELRKQQREAVATLMAMVAKAGAAAGMVAVFVYCFFVARFFPVGLQVGDSLFFVFVVLGIGLLGALVSGFGIFAITPWVSRHRLPPSPGSAPNHQIFEFLVLLGCGVVALACVYFFAGAYQMDSGTSRTGRLAFLGVVFVASVVIHLWHSTELVGLLSAIQMSFAWVLTTLILGLLLSEIGSGPAVAWGGSMLTGGAYIAFGIDHFNQAKLRSVNVKKGMTFIGIAIIIPFVAGAGGQMFGAVFTNMGVRAERATVIVNRVNFEVLQAAADGAGIRLHACEVAADTHAVSGVDILWHGIGQRSYVALHDRPRQATATPSVAEQSTEVRVELDSSGVKKSPSNGRASCVELRRGIYFASGQHELDDKQWAVAAPLVEKFLADAIQETPSGARQNLVIIGYTDPMFDAHSGNQKLARDRACFAFDKVKEKLDELYRNRMGVESQGCKNDKARCEKLIGLWSTPRVYVDTRIGSGDTACSAKENSDAQRACYEKDRRVTLQSVDVETSLDRIGIVEAKRWCPENSTTTDQPKQAGKS